MNEHVEVTQKERAEVKEDRILINAIRCAYLGN